MEVQEACLNEWATGAQMPTALRISFEDGLRVLADEQGPTTQITQDNIHKLRFDSDAESSDTEDVEGLEPPITPLAINYKSMVTHSVRIRSAGSR